MDNLPEMDEWEAADKMYISDEHHILGLEDICSEGCDWCMSDIDPDFDE